MLGNIGFRALDLWGTGPIWLKIHLLNTDRHFSHLQSLLRINPLIREYEDDFDNWDLFNYGG